MATSWKSQQSNGEYNLQFETTDKERYKLVEKAVQMAVDGKTISDIAEVKYGVWGKPILSTEGWMRECSICLYCTGTGVREFKPLFCSNCGATMDGGYDA